MINDYNDYYYTEGEEIFKEMQFDKELDQRAKYMVKELTRINPLDCTFLNDIFYENVKYFKEFKMYDKHVKYISTRGEKAAYLSVTFIGNYLKISNYKLLTSETVYNDIISAYNVYFTKLIITKSADHLIRTLVSIRNKFTDQENKNRINNYIYPLHFKMRTMANVGFESYQ